MSESRVLSDIEICCSHFRIAVLPRSALRLSCSAWSMPDPQYHVGVIWRTNTGAARIGRRMVRFGVAGTPDFEGWRFQDGRRMTIEAKSEKGVLSGHQIAYAALARNTGTLHGVARSYDECSLLLEAWGMRRNQ